MLVVIGILAALYERRTSGIGQVVDAAMIDGTSLMMQDVFSLESHGNWGPRGTNRLDGGAPFYGTYECSDGRYVAVAALEPQFFEALIRGLGLASTRMPAQNDTKNWHILRSAFEAAFARRTRDEWAETFSTADACVTPVLAVSEVAQNEHIRERGTVTEVKGVLEAMPAPRFSRSRPSSTDFPPASPRSLAEAVAIWA